MPLTAYACPCLSVPPALATPLVSGATPVCSRPSCEKLRPFRGRSTSSRPLTTRPSTLVDVSTTDPPPFTVTVSLTADSSSCTLTRTDWLTFTCTGCCTTVPNCCASTVTL